jgi:hypothetical protein
MGHMKTLRTVLTAYVSVRQENVTFSFLSHLSQTVRLEVLHSLRNETLHVKIL